METTHIILPDFEKHGQREFFIAFKDDWIYKAWVVGGVESEADEKKLFQLAKFSSAG